MLVLLVRLMPGNKKDRASKATEWARILGSAAWALSIVAFARSFSPADQQVINVLRGFVIMALYVMGFLIIAWGVVRRPLMICLVASVTVAYASVVPPAVAGARTPNFMIGIAGLVISTLIWMTLHLAGLFLSKYAGDRIYPRFAKGMCEGCGYDLRGNVSGRCPECGLPVSTKRDGHR